MKKKYEKPGLELFGTVSQLSAGGSAGSPEGGDGAGVDLARPDERA